VKLFLLALLLGGLSDDGAWTPPRNPDPSRILNEAREDTSQGRHEAALAKFLWFHHNALKYRSSLYGVRLSFALSYWFELAERHPPALAALEKNRDDALRDFKRDRKGENAFAAFNDFESINQTLGEESRTAAAFEELDAEDPEAAARVFHVAREALIRAKAYKLCGKYLRPSEDWLRAAQMYQMTRSHDQDDGGLGGYAEKSFTNQVATLLALLVVNERREEAELIAHKARLEWDSPAFRAAIDDALAGTMPEPYP
jgi:hypothetical protein